MVTQAAYKDIIKILALLTLCERKLSVTRGFSTQRTQNTESLSISWCHRVLDILYFIMLRLVCGIYWSHSDKFELNMLEFLFDRWKIFSSVQDNYLLVFSSHDIENIYCDAW